MNANFENTMSRIADEARGRYARLVRQARLRTESAADRVVKGKKPVKTLSGLGLKLTAISHKTADKVLQQQARMVENQIDAIAGRLKAVADARNVGDLLRTQIRLIPQNASRLAGDARSTLGIVAGAGVEVRDVISGTFAELRGKRAVTGKARVKKTTAKKAAKKTAKKVVKARGKARASGTQAAA